MRWAIFLSGVCLLSAVAGACDRCGCSSGGSSCGGASGITASDDAGEYKWSLDTSFDYRNFKRRPDAESHAIVERGRDTHSFLDDILVTERLGYKVTNDLDVGVTQGFRRLRKTEIEDEDHLGLHEFSEGATDLEFDIKWRFKQQKDDGFPVDLAVFGHVSVPTGTHRNRTKLGDLFETEEQPGTGGVEGTGGLAASKRWGLWGASGAVSYSIKGEGVQRFKEGNSFRASLSAARQLTPATLSWKVYASLGVQGLVEQKAVDHGSKSPDHGGQTIFVLPGISAQPLSRLNLSVNGSVPVYQEQNGFHQHQNYGVQCNVGIRF